MKRLGRHIFEVFVLATSLMVPFAGKVSAKEAWAWSADIYGWMPEIDSRLLNRNETTITFDDILDNLDFAAMGVVQAERGLWSFFTDLIYLDLGDQPSGTVDIGPITAPASVNANMQSYIGNFGVGYTLNQTDRSKFGVFGAARYFQLDYDLDASVGPIARSVSQSESTWDAVIGLRGHFDLNEDWYIHYLADVGAGGSDLTWQALGAIAYRFENVDVTFGYRHLAWELDDFGPFDKVDVSGPFVGVRFNF